MMSWLKYDKIMLAGSIPRVKKRKKISHLNYRYLWFLCIIGPTVITWAYQLIGMLPASMCYAGSPCGTLKCALLAAIAMPNRSANFILYILTLNHAFSTMRGLDWHLCFDAHTRRSGWQWSSWTFPLGSPRSRTHPWTLPFLWSYTHILFLNFTLPFFCTNFTHPLFLILPSPFFVWTLPTPLSEFYPPLFL